MKGAPAITPGVNTKLSDNGIDPELAANSATRNRNVVAKANYLSLDRPDIKLNTQEQSRDMAKP